MNRILAPTDFSENAENAAAFALKIAEKTGAKVFLFHASHIPIVSPDAPYNVYGDIIQANQKAETSELERLRDKLLTHLDISDGEIEIECVNRLGFAVDEIRDFSNENKIDLIVMGTKGATGLSKVFVGTNTESVIRSVAQPVLVIPENCLYKDFESIMIAADYHDSHSEKTLLPLIELTLLYDSEIMVFNVQPEKEYVPSFEEAEEGLKLETRFKSIPHTYYFSENENTVNGIEEFISSKKPDLLVMFSHKHTFLENVLGRANTSEMAFQTRIPLLVLPLIN